MDLLATKDWLTTEGADDEGFGEDTSLSLLLKMVVVEEMAMKKSSEFVTADRC